MDLLEEMLRDRDYYESYDSPSEARKNLNESIDKIITEGMQKRRG